MPFRHHLDTLRHFRYAIASVCAVALFLWIVFHFQWWEPQGTPSQNAIYVWQEVWGSKMSPALERAKGRSDAFWVYAAEATCDKGILKERFIPADWKTLSQTGKPVVAVVRMGVKFSSLLKTPRRTEVARHLDAAFRRIERSAQNAFVRLDGFQLDYDCPTARLDDYRALANSLRIINPRRRISLTTLPAWLDHNEFRALVRGADFFVLQAHSIERPKTPGQPLILCDTAKIPHWVRLAGNCGVPFYLALPTYGYNVVYDPKGEFAGIVSENRAILRPKEGYRVEQIMADPEAIAETVRSLTIKHPRQLAGFAWFRLPVDTDRMNWSWPTLSAVIDGRAPRSAFRVTPAPDGKLTKPPLGTPERIRQSDK
jgi:hypothetical protein